MTARRGILVSWLAAAVACSHDAPVKPLPPPPPTDSIAPTVEVLFPDSTTAFDRDSDGLVDVELRWHDSGGAIDPASVSVQDRYVEGASLGPNLAGTWTLTRLDSAGAVLKETVPGLLRAGTHELLVRVADTAGNVGSAHSQYFFLPPAAYSRTINLRLMPSCQPETGVNLALSPDGRQGYAPFLGCIAVFRTAPPDSVHFVTGVPNAHFAANIVMDTATGLAYLGGGGVATGGLTIFNTHTEQVVRQVDVPSYVAGLDLHDDRIFVGEACSSGQILVLDKRTFAKLAEMNPGVSTGGAVCANSATFAFTADGGLGWTGIVFAGLQAFDARHYVLLDRTDLSPPADDAYWGDARDILLAGGRWLYIAKVRSGLDELDVRTGQITAHYPRTAPPYPTTVELALSPDGKTLFVSADTSASGPDTEAAPLVFDVPGLRLRYRLPVRSGHLTDAVVFAPDGRQVFMMAEFGVYVYIIRP